MIAQHAARRDRAIRPAAGPSLIHSPWGLFVLWRHRAASRAALRTMPDHLLEDIGIDRVEAFREAAKPFWRA